jgi:hypothetical protein
MGLRDACLDQSLQKPSLHLKEWHTGQSADIIIGGLKSTI